MRKHGIKARNYIRTYTHVLDNQFHTNMYVSTACTCVNINSSANNASRVICNDARNRQENISGQIKNVKTSLLHTSKLLQYKIG